MGKKVVDILPPQPEEPAEAGEKAETKFSLPRISLPRVGFPPGRRPRLVSLALFLAIGGALWAYFALGEARIEIWPELENLTVETKITADKSASSIDLSQKIVPGFLFEEMTSLSGEFTSSGKKTVETKAGGAIRVYNNSSVSQTLVASTRFQPPLEKFEEPLKIQENPWFRSQSRIVVSAKGFRDVEVLADSPGEKYNIKPSKFSIPGLAGSAQYTLVFGESFQQFTGGEKKELAQILSQDLDNAQDSLFQRARDESEKKLREKTPLDYLFLADALKTELLEGLSLAKTGEELEKFDYRVSAKSWILAPKYGDLKDLINSLFSSQLGSGKQMDDASFRADYSLFSADKNSNRIVISSQASINAFAGGGGGWVDELSLKKALSGKSLQEAKSILEKQEGLQKIKIRLWPFWLRSVPNNIEKVKIELKLSS